MTEIPHNEFAARLARLRDLVRAAELDAYVVSDKESIYYLTGATYEPLERPFFIIVDAQDRADMIVPLMEQRHLAKAPPWFAIQSYREFPAPAGEGWSERLAAALDRNTSVGVEPSLPYAQARVIKDGAVSIHPFIETLRRVKSPLEVQLLRRSAGFAVTATQTLLGASGYGRSIVEGFMAKREVMQQVVASLPYWEPLTTDIVMATWAAPRSAEPHSIPALTDVMREGPHVALVLSRINGYATECERTFFAAPPSADDRDLFGVMMQARAIGMGMIRPGVPGAEIDAAVNDYLKSKGQAEHLLHRTGHGFGLGAHEGPWIAEGGEDVLAENMVISIEPGLYVPGYGGYRHSDTILVTADGFEVLTPLPTSLDEMTLAAAS